MRGTSCGPLGSCFAPDIRRLSHRASSDILRQARDAAVTPAVARMVPGAMSRRFGPSAEHQQCWWHEQTEDGRLTISGRRVAQFVVFGISAPCRYSTPDRPRPGPFDETRTDRERILRQNIVRPPSAGPPRPPAAVPLPPFLWQATSCSARADSVPPLRRLACSRASRPPASPGGVARSCRSRLPSRSDTGVDDGNGREG